MFGRKKKALEARVELLERTIREEGFGKEGIKKELDATQEECAKILASFEVRLRKAEKHAEATMLELKAVKAAHGALGNRVARDEMRIKERMDEYALAIIDNERGIRALAESGERRTLSDMVNEHADEDKVSAARIMDEWLNGKAEGSDDE